MYHRGGEKSRRMEDFLGEEKESAFRYFKKITKNFTKAIDFFEKCDIIIT